MRKLLALSLLFYSSLASAAFPTVLSVTESVDATPSTSHSADYPATVDAGDLLILAGCFEGTALHTTLAEGSGWTLLWEGVDSGNATIAVWALSAVGDEDGGTIATFTSGGSSVTDANQMIRIQEGTWGGTVATDIDIGTVVENTGIVASFDAPSVTAGWGSDDNLYIPIAGFGDDDETISTYPTNYSNGVDTPSGAGSNASCTVASARRELAASSDDPGTFVFSANAGGAVNTLVVEPSAASAPAFSVAPTVQSTTATSYTMSFTVDSASTVHAIACTVGEAPPSEGQLKTPLCQSGAAVHASATPKAVTGADTIVISGVSFPHSDIHLLATNGNGDSAITSLTNEARSADSGQEFVVLASVSATSVFDDDAYYDPDVAAGDVVEADSTTSPGAFAITWETDGDFSYTDATGSRQSIDYCVQDVSDATGEFTTPACWTVDDQIWINNTAPVCSNTDFDPVVLTEDVAMTTIDLDIPCTDADGDQPTYTLTTGTLPVGTSLGGTGSSEWTGTPSTEDEAGTALIFTATDIAGDTDTLSATVYVVETVTNPLVTDSDIDDAVIDVQAAFPWRVDDLGFTVTFSCGAEAVNEILTQDPAAAAEVTAFEPLSAVASTGIACPIPGVGKGRPGVKLPGLRNTL